MLVVARKGSPLMVGVGKDEFIVASDASAIVAHTTQAFALDDYTVAQLTRDGFRTTTLDNVPVTPKMMELEDGPRADRAGRLRPLHAQGDLRAAPGLAQHAAGPPRLQRGEIVLGGLATFARELVQARRIVLTGQGTALHAGHGRPNT